MGDLSVRHALVCMWSTYSLTAFESGDLTITCTILYPEQFDALRRTYDCDKIMIESLARCIKWKASGGKSGSAFLKTRGKSNHTLLCSSNLQWPMLADDRFIAKELSRAELETMTTFAPAYFDYMSSAVMSKVRRSQFCSSRGCQNLFSGRPYSQRYLVVTKSFSRNLPVRIRNEMPNRSQRR